MQTIFPLTELGVFISVLLIIISFIAAFYLSLIYFYYRDTRMLFPFIAMTLMFLYSVFDFISSFTLSSIVYNIWIISIVLIPLLFAYGLYRMNI